MYKFISEFLLKTYAAFYFCTVNALTNVDIRA